MSKYAPLWAYFQGKNEASLELTFDQIAEVLTFPIDHSFLTFKKELSDYGYQVKKIYLKDKKVLFEKIS